MVNLLYHNFKVTVIIFF